MAILEIVVGLLLLKALSGNSSTGKAPTPTPKPQAVPDSTGGGGGLGQAAIGLGTTALTGLAGKGASAIATAAAGSGATIGGAAATVAWLAGQGAIGAVITKDPYGAAAGVVFGSPLGVGGNFLSVGNVANIFRRVMLEIFLLLGGQATSAASIALQVSGFIGGLLVAAYGTSYFPIVALALIVIAGVASLIDDGSRLVYGQFGLLADLKLLAERYFWESRPHLHAVAAQGLATTTGDAKGLQLASLSKAQREEFELNVSAACAAQTLGFIREDNAWRARVFEHHQNGKDMGWAALRGIWLQEAFWPLLQNHVFLLVQMGAFPTGLAQDIPAAQVPEKVAAGQRAYFKIPAVNLTALEGAGKILCNIRNYLSAMLAEWGIGANGLDHARYQRDQLGQFTGLIDPATGDLLDGNGNRCSWTLSSNAQPPHPVLMGGAPRTGV